MSRHQSSARSGAALIIAMIILIALMLLGLPFLFSQSMGLAGTRTLQAAQTAHIYGITAQNFGSAIAVYGTQDHWLTNKTQPWTALQIYLSDFPLGPTSTPLLATPLNTVSQIPVNPGAVGFNPTGAKALIGTTISDESGRISANTLGPKGWTEVLKSVNIMDWDDSEVVLPAGFYPNAQLDDYNPTGQLVDAIMALRLRMGPFTKLDDLLGADPRQLFSQKIPITEFRPRLSRAELARLGTILTFHNPAPGRGLIDLGNVVAECTDNSFTHFLLTDMPEGLLADESWLESESVKPGNQRAWAYVGSSVQNNAQGNALMRNSLFSSNTNAQGIMHGGSGNAFGKVGDGLALAAPPSINIHEIGAAERLVEPYKDWPVIPLLPAPAGIRTYPDLYALTLAAASIYSFSGGELLKPFMGPDTARRERQPASLATSGVFRVQSASTVRDSAGNIAAQETRTSIVQAVPQEQALELRWNSQDTLELLSRQRWTSAMESRPKAINRIIDLKPDITPYPSIAPNSSGGLSPATLPTLADNAAAGSTRTAPVHLNITWRSTFGRDKAVAAGDERKDSRAVLPETTVSNQADDDALETEGVMLRQDKVVAISLDAPAPAAPQSGPLTRVMYGALMDQEMSSRHLSFWFKQTTDWTTGAVVPIMEVRMPVDITATLAVDAAGKCITTEAGGVTNPGSNSQQNYVGLYFDPKPFSAAPDATIRKLTMLALCISAPSAEHKVAPLYNMGDDITFIPGANKFDLFAGVDERSLTGPLSLAPILGDTFSRRSNFSRLLKDNRVMHGVILPKEGLEKHRWYHVQIALGTGQPGSVAVVLDGLPGRDLTAVDDPGLKPKAGDRFTVPALLLATTVLARENLPGTDLEMRDTIFPLKIEVKVPSILGLAGLRVEELIPARGMIRVGDEYIRYGTMTPNSDWKMPATLNACARGQRQNTQTDSAIPAYQWPATQRHEVGSLVVPGDFYVALADTIPPATPNRDTFLSHLYSGASTLSDDFKNGDPDPKTSIGANDLILQWQTWAVFSGGTPNPDPLILENTFTGGDITLTTPPNVPISAWPKNGGVVRLLTDAGMVAVIYYHYDKVVGNKLINLQPLVDSTNAPLPGFDYRGLAPTTDVFGYSTKSDAVPPLVWLVSMAVEGDQWTEVEGRPPFPYPVDAAPSRAALQATQNPKPARAPCMAQLLAPNGRCEWISYQTIVLDKTTIRSYLVNSGGWGWAEESVTHNAVIARGQQRSAFMGTYPYRVEQFKPDYTPVFPAPSIPSAVPIHDGAAATFPAVDTVVVPVQTENDVAGHWFEAGDVVTLTPKIRGEPKALPIPPRVDGLPFRPVQRIIRFVSHDGFGRANQLPATRKPYDAKDGYFAFTAGLPYPMVSNDWLAVCGTGWNANRDWSSGSNYPQPPSCLPRLDGFTFPDLDPLKPPLFPGALIFGGEDLRSNSPNTTSRPGVDLQIDALCAGTWPGVINIAGRQISPGVVAFVSGTAIVYTMPKTGALPMYAVGNGDIFSTGVDRRMGLVEIDGEVFAFQQLNPVAVSADAAALAALRAASLALDADASWNGGQSRRQVVKLVGRALLGSEGRIHLITSETPTPTTVVVEPLFAPLPIQMLPIGPVYDIPDADQIDSGWFSFSDGEMDANKKLIPKVLQAPALVICNPDGSIASTGTNLESLFPAGPDRNQGIPNMAVFVPNPNYNKYHTAEWLRGLYNTTRRSWTTGTLPPLAVGWWPRYPSAMPESAVTLTAQHYRSRVYSWAGFPWHLHRMRFDPSNFISAHADAEENDNLPLTIEAKVMAGAIDGDLTADGAREGFNSYLDWSKLATESVSTSGLWNSSGSIFSWPYAKKEADGIEVRLSWRYNPIPTRAINPADDLALPMNRAPVISTMTLHGYAPVTVLATEGSR